jgi:hypothetical protein
MLIVDAPTEYFLPVPVDVKGQRCVASSRFSSPFIHHSAALHSFFRSLTSLGLFLCLLLGLLLFCPLSCMLHRFLFSKLRSARPLPPQFLTTKSRTWAQGDGRVSRKGCKGGNQDASDLVCYNQAPYKRHVALHCCCASRREQNSPHCHAFVIPQKMASDVNARRGHVQN